MIDFPLQLHTINIAGESIQLYVPDPKKVFEHYQLQKSNDISATFAYWTQIWPSAKAMAEFLILHTHLVEGKQVLELAAGLGLPSLVAARFAKQVHCSEYFEEAVGVVEKSISLNNFENIKTSVLDWHHLPEDISADILLLSDINYDPSEFDTLFRTIKRFIDNGTVIILSTPQRLMAKPFIERLLPWCIAQKEIMINEEEQLIAVNIFLLHSTNTSEPKTMKE
jgi:predicted nicotinamide N-methyase